MDDSDRLTDEQDGIDEEGLRRRYYERLSDWSELGAVKINRNGKLVEPVSRVLKVESLDPVGKTEPRESN
jgi:hypothetical protein